MSASESSVSLRNGVSMPLLGLGTSHYGGYNQEAVVYALRDCGYRLIDTAQRYGCEKQVGKAITISGVPRENVFLTTKLWPSYYGCNKALEQAKISMSNLNTDYLDLFLLHWPADNKGQSDLTETWRALELLLEEGKVKAIGVSNFQQRHLNRLLDQCSVVPFVNQCEFHPYQNDKELRSYCREYAIRFDGYSPLGKGELLHDANIQQISKNHQKTPAQVLIKWSIQNGVVTIPKSTKKERVKENSDIWDFDLSTDDMRILNNLHQNLRVTWDPSYVP